MKYFVEKKWTLLIFVAPIILLLLPLLLKFGHQYPNPDELDNELTEFAGANSINCGIIDIDDPNRVDIDNCAIAAYKSAKPFRVRYDDFNGDYPRCVGVYRDMSGEVGMLHYSALTNFLNTPILGVSWAGGQQSCSTSALATEEDKRQRRKKRRRIFFDWSRCNDKL